VTVVPRTLTLVALGLLAASLPGCEKVRSAAGGGPRFAVDHAAERTLARGPARIGIVVRSGSVRYRLAGRLDTAHGYRVCAAIRQGPTGYLVRRVLWLEGRRGTYGTLTAHGGRCEAGAAWLDDHPPTLELFDIRAIPTGGRAGAEDYLHSALLALLGLTRAAPQSEPPRPCGRARCHRVLVPFERFDREPRIRDEDGWTLRPLVRALGAREVDVRVSRAGFVTRLRLVAPPRGSRMPGRVTVALTLSAFGHAPAVPLVRAKAIE
jgi:hypothetical protein